MTESKREKRHHDELDRRDDTAPESQERAGDVRQDEALTSAERLPRRGDHEIPPGGDTSV